MQITTTNESVYMVVLLFLATFILAIGGSLLVLLHGTYIVRDDFPL